MENLVVVILSPTESQITDEIFKKIDECGCCVAEARLNTTAAHVTLTLLVNGAWNTIAKFESVLKRYTRQVLSDRTQPRPARPDSFPYSSYIVTPNAPNVLMQLTQFLSEQGVTLFNMQVESYSAPITEAKMLAISLSFGFPIKNLVADFREHFIVFCDDHNFDVAMEPQKN